MVRDACRPHRLGGAVAGLTLLGLMAALVLGSGPFALGGTRATGRSSPAGVVTRIIPVGATNPARTLAITVVLAGQAPDALRDTVAALANPTSPEYHHFLTPAQFAQRFGAPAAATTQVTNTLRAAGLRVLDRSADGLLLRVQGTVGAVERLFGVAIEDYRTSAGGRFYSTVGAPRIPAALRGLVTGVLGLESYSAARPASIRHFAAGSTGYSPTELANAYDFGPLKSAGIDGSGQTVAFAEIDTFKQADINTYDHAFGISAPDVQVVQVGGGASPADKVSETTLDIEVVHAIAPRTQVIAYEGGGDTQSLVQTFSQIVSDHKASIMSISLGLCEKFALDPSQAPQDLQSAFTSSGQTFFSALDQTFQQADALGMSILVSSGDTGAYGCNQFDASNHDVTASAPATSPYVTAVGGTALFTGANGSYDHEDGWEGALEGAGGGGGVSLVYPVPSWQSGPGVSNQFSNGKRQVPDVSADADPLTGYAIYDSTDTGCSGDQCWGVVGGTSASAPLWAGLIALANQKGGASGKGPAGFLNPLLYQIGTAASGGGSAPFHDVTGGGNLYYPATRGWDFSTGWGTPDASVLVQSLLAAEPSK